MKLKNFSLFVLISLICLARYFLPTKKNNCLILNHVNFFNASLLTIENNKSLYIKDGLISEINSADFFDNSRFNCSTIDAIGQYALPGLIDAHTHVLAHDKQRVYAWKEALELSALRPTISRLLIAEKNVISLLHAGFTTIRDLGNSGYFLDMKLQQLLAQKSEPALDLIYSGPALAVWPTQINANLSPDEYKLIDSTTDLDSVMNLYKSKGATWIKLYADNSDKNSVLNEELAKKVIALAQKHNLKTSVHAEFLKSQELALSIKPNSIEHFYDTPSELAAPALDTKTYVVVTDYNMQACKNLKFIPDCDKQKQQLSNRLAWLKLNNYKIVFGSDAILDYSAQLKSRGNAAIESLINMTVLGLSNTEALVAATKTAAEMLGINTGVIAEKYEADIVLYTHNPIENINELRKPQTVISNGAVACKNENECVP